MKRIIIDLDNTISINKNNNYDNAEPSIEVVNQLKKYQNLGFEIVIHTSRNMRTYEGNIGKINANTLPKVIDWLEKHKIPYDEIHIGKPWCGHEGFYVDDKAIRPDEFVNLSYEQIINLLEKCSVSN